ncbi:MAG: hypothetical protein WCW27_02970 [Patescibacteria group bacterium]
MKKITWLLVLSSIALTGSGCAKNLAEQAAEKVIEKQTGQKTDIQLNNGSADVTIGDTTTSLGSGTSVPTNWPTDVPLEENIIPKASLVNTTTATLSYNTTKAANDVINFYKQQLNNKGWKEEASTQANGTYSYITTKDKKKTMITYSADPTSADQKLVTVTVTTL